jgi:hypothetical protein
MASAEGGILHPVGNHRAVVAFGDKASLESFGLDRIARSMRLADRNTTLNKVVAGRGFWFHSASRFRNLHMR